MVVCSAREHYTTRIGLVDASPPGPETRSTFKADVKEHPLRTLSVFGGSPNVAGGSVVCAGIPRLASWWQVCRPRPLVRQSRKVTTRRRTLVWPKASDSSATSVTVRLFQKLWSVSRPWPPGSPSPRWRSSWPEHPPHSGRRSAQYSPHSRATCLVDGFRRFRWGSETMAVLAAGRSDRRSLSNKRSPLRSAYASLAQRIRRRQRTRGPLARRG